MVSSPRSAGRDRYRRGVGSRRRRERERRRRQARATRAAAGVSRIVARTWRSRSCRRSTCLTAPSTRLASSAVSRRNSGSSGGELATAGIGRTSNDSGPASTSGAPPVSSRTMSTSYRPGGARFPTAGRSQGARNPSGSSEIGSGAGRRRSHVVRCRPASTSAVSIRTTSPAAFLTRSTTAGVDSSRSSRRTSQPGNAMSSPAASVAFSAVRRPALRVSMSAAR